MRAVFCYCLCLCLAQLGAVEGSVWLLRGPSHLEPEPSAPKQVTTSTTSSWLAGLEKSFISLFSWQQERREEPESKPESAGEVNDAVTTGAKVEVVKQDKAQVTDRAAEEPESKSDATDNADTSDVKVRVIEQDEPKVVVRPAPASNTGSADESDSSDVTVKVDTKDVTPNGDAAEVKVVDSEKHTDGSDGAKVRITSMERVGGKDSNSTEEEAKEQVDSDAKQEKSNAKKKSSDAEFKITIKSVTDEPDIEDESEPAKFLYSDKEWSSDWGHEWHAEQKTKKVEKKEVEIPMYERTWRG